MIVKKIILLTLLLTGLVSANSFIVNVDAKSDQDEFGSRLDIVKPA